MDKGQGASEWPPTKDINRAIESKKEDIKKLEEILSEIEEKEDRIEEIEEEIENLKEKAKDIAGDDILREEEGWHRY